tara:strand:- start:3208 stop:3474 length:267 start_codon:yes stop_codon:yes gene_type:complete
MNWLIDKLSKLLCLSPKDNLEHDADCGPPQTSAVESDVKKAEEIQQEQPDLSSLRVVELKAIASKLNLTGLSRLNKTELIKLIHQNNK